MNLSQINTPTLRQILKLSEKKDLLLKEVNEIETTIEGLVKGNTKVNPSSPTQPKSKKSSPKKTPRGMIKESVLKALSEAGPLGIKVNELSKQLGIESKNLHVWFSNTGKKIQGIEKVAPGHFRLHQQEEEKPSIQSPQEEIKEEAISLY